MADMHALIIDDTLVSADVLSMLLSAEGIGSTAISSPRDLADTLDNLQQLTVIFLDLEIPDYDGFEVLVQLKAQPQFADIPIIAYTVHTSEKDAARQAGFDGFLGKPIRASDFPVHLRSILSGEAVWE